MDNPFKSPITAISIGPGIRGLERGIERTGARLRVLSYVEIEAFICENLVAQMELGLLDSALIWSDAKTFPAQYFRDIVDILLAGYPCQPFSNAGKRKGADDPRHLYPYIERTIDIVRPKIVFFENVRGHVTLGLREVKQSLEERGYRVHWGIFSAEETGASHKRERVFIMGIRSDVLESAGEEIENKEQWQERNEVHRERMWAELRIDSQLAYSNEQGLSNSTQRKQRVISESDESFQGSESSGVYSKKVARPGQPQHAWESPRTVITEKAARLLGGYSKKYPEGFQKWQVDQVAFDEFTGTVKPSLGCSVNGHDFREDFLRALGNSVYEQTAELAFRALLKKFEL